MDALRRRNAEYIRKDAMRKADLVHNIIGGSHHNLEGHITNARVLGQVIELVRKLANAADLSTLEDVSSDVDCLDWSARSTHSE